MADRTCYKYIAIEGNIGVGKTTLARRLSKKINSKLMLEKYRNNHFLPLFYNDRDKYGLHVELSFLIDRYEDHTIFRRTKKRIVSDYFFSKTLLFAKVNLDKHAFRIFQRVYSNFEDKVLKPDLIIFLRRDVDHLLKNIKARKRNEEKDIKEHYLSEVQKSYDTYLNDLRQHRILSLDISASNLKNDTVINKIVALTEVPYPFGITAVKI